MRFTYKQQQILDLLLDGCEWADLENRLHITRDAVKQRLSCMYKRAGIPANRLSLIALVVQETYRRRPELIPFADGDRALQIGDIPAAVYARVRVNSY